MMLRPLIAVSWLAWALAAGPVLAEANAQQAASGAVAPGVRGTLALEPGRIRAGELATLEVVVTTPPGHRLRPVTPPAELPGFWILDAEALPVEKEDGRWIHRTRFRLRARDLGQFVWPAQPVEIEGPDGAAQRLVLDGRPLEVVSVQPDFPGRSVPFGLREPGVAGETVGSAWQAAAVGALGGATAVALTGLLLRARRRRHALVSRTRAHGEAPSPWKAAHAEIDAAAARLGSEPGPGLDALATAIRSYATARWRKDVRALTTPELARLAPPPESAPHWPELIALLRSLDDARFLPPAAVGGGRSLLGGEALARARALVVATTPAGAGR